MQKTFENVCLKQDNGQDLSFRGSLYSECSWFDEDQKQMTRQKLYLTDKNEQIYYIVRSAGEEKSHHAYRFSVKDDQCIIDNGKTPVTLPFDMLMLVVRDLCGLSEAESAELSDVQELKRMSNG
ncbi:MAG: hypothetical protein IJS50_04075 [Desulfovibrio sp.]|nr:hypothetical protein [Desulfovibrio sp.]